MTWDIEYTDLFGTWWDGLTEAEQKSVDAAVTLLECVGPELPYPYCSQIKGSQYGRMRELRVQHAANRTVFCMRSIHVAPAFCCSVATRPATNAGMQ